MSAIETRAESSARIMIVDDTPENLSLLRDMLTEQGYEVMALPSGPLALRAAEKCPPDLILLDVKMPEMDGYEVCIHLKRHPLLQEIPVIFLSALASADDKIKAFCAGGADYITKPFVLEDVLARVSSHLARSAATAGASAEPEAAADTVVSTTVCPVEDEARAGIAAETAYPPPLPAALPGVDVTAGLRMVGGKHAVYHELLRRFAVGRGDTVRRLSDALAGNDYEAAARMAHSMISIAAMLGAFRLSSAAAVLEKAIDTEISPSAPLHQFAEAFASVYAGISRFVADSTDVAGGAAHHPPAGETLKIIREMEMLLETDIAQAFDLRKDLREHLADTPLAGRIGLLEGQLDRFDIAGAADTLRSLATAVERQDLA